MKLFITVSIIALLSLSGYNELQAQSNKKVLGIEDVKLWRNHSVALSDDGEWYTVLYSLREKPESKKDTTKENGTKKKINDYYGEDNQTDTLYICNSKDGVKYQVSDGSKPKFSSASDWVAYQIKPESEKEEKDKKNKKDNTIIELKNLKSGYTIQYKSNAKYSFTEDKNYFITSDDNSLLVYDLDNRREHYIGNIGEYLIDKKSDYIAYTISSDDKRGNGIYLYSPKNMTTRALQTGNFMFSNLSWNKEKNSLTAYKYNKVDDKIDYTNMSIVVASGIDSDATESFEYLVKDFQGMPENMGPAVKFERYSNKITWSRDGERLFIKIKEYDQDKEKKDKKDKESKEEPTVNVWHWKDKKLLSQRMMEEEEKKNEVYDAIFFRKSKKIVQLSSKEIQELIISEGTDNWVIGMDNRKYISDWDVFKNDLYRINLLTGDKNLIKEKSSGSVEISPDGEKIVLWDGEHYWCYDLKNDTKHNISARIGVSFVDKENDLYGYVPDYGFVAWVKDQDAVIVKHKLDLWLLPLDNSSKAQNLTASVTSKDSIRFRFDDLSFKRKPEIDERYIDLSSPNILYAFNIKTKYAGYYLLQNDQLKELIYKPASFSSSRWRRGLIKAEKSDAIIYKMGNYQDYPEAYLSNLEFSKSKKITNTNPQQKTYKWGKRILIDYTNDDGVPLQAVLSIPGTYKKGQKLPMIVYSYEKMSQSMYNYPTPYLSGASVCEMMYVSDDYLFLRPDIHFNVGTPHSDMHECINAAIEKVIELGYLDEKRIGYEGFSYGGHCGMYISTQDNKFAAIAAGAGVSNLVQGFNIDIVWDGSNEQDYYMTQQGRLGTDPTSNTEMYISESAVFNAQNMNTPLLLFHGTADHVVNWEHSFGFYSILRYLKKPVVFLSYQGEGHGFRKKENREDIQMRLKEYFDHYLKDKEAGKWMIEELPYEPKEKTKEDKKDKRTVPMWK
jgi:dipeptidyl aminopeptidase/acylaminoacyl peptidase